MSPCKHTRFGSGHPATALGGPSGADQVPAHGGSGADPEQAATDPRQRGGEPPEEDIPVKHTTGGCHVSNAEEFKAERGDML
jgi:hypothetical protein